MKYDVSFLKPNEQEKALNQLKEPKFINKELKISCFENATILPVKDVNSCLGGIVNSSGDFVKDSGFYEERTVGYYNYIKKDVLQDSSVVIYIGFLLSSYGHLITDDIKKIWAIYTGDIKYDKVVYISDWQDRNPPRHVVELFSLLGIDITSWQCVNKITTFKKILLPESSFIHHNGKKYFTVDFRNTIQQIKSRIPINKRFVDSKVFFSRRGFSTGWKRECGEKQIERVFYDKGFLIIHPELLSVSEQISIAMSCKEFASTEGSIGHNSIWCQPNTNVILIRKVNLLNIWQLAINEVADLDVTYIDAHRSTQANKQFPMIGPFFMCITPELERWFGSRILHLPLWIRPSWVNYRFQLDQTLFVKKIIRHWKDARYIFKR